MKRISLCLIIIVFALTANAQVKTNGSGLLNKNLVDLRGKEGQTIFVNSTTDTLKIKGTFFNWLPYTETGFSLGIPPGRRDTLRMQYNYPDFINANNFRLYNAPGGVLTCDVKDLNSNAPVIDFSGSCAAENSYYQAYNNFLGNYDNESRPYYTAGNVVKNWESYPAMADSITQIRLDFLKSYTGDISAGFKDNEQQRLIYNGIMRKYNVLLSKEFYGGTKIPIKDSYYSFEKDIKLADEHMLLNTEYLWVTDAYFFKASKMITKPVPEAMLYAIDSLCKLADVADMLKMRRLYMLYTSAKNSYDSVLNITRFADATLKTVVDSLVHVKLGLPKAGKKAPEFSLSNVNGKQINLADFRGKNIIINFWATWCGPCIKEFPADNQLHEQYKNKGLVVINICVDSKYETWHRISKTNKLQMINLFADGAAGERIKSLYNISALPRSILINKQGLVTDNYFKRASQLSDQQIAEILR
jgi:peroxiredoxin